jgi:hypothetical protein
MVKIELYLPNEVNRRYKIRLVNDRFLIRKPTLCATASKDGNC